MSMAHSPPPQQPEPRAKIGWENEEEEDEEEKDCATTHTMERAGGSSSAVTPPPAVIVSREIKELWSSTLQSLYNEMKEIGKALTCSICQATFHQPVLLPCVHAFCKDCLQKSLRGLRKCPVCMTKATPRSFMDAPFLEGVVHSYKELLRSLGMTPIVYDDAVGMTQLPPSQDVDDEDDDEDDDMTDGHVSNLPPHLRGRTPSLIECSTHLALSRLWQHAFLQEQQQLPPNSDLERKKLSSLLQDQNRVVAVDERILVRAAAVRHHARGKPTVSNKNGNMHECTTDTLVQDAQPSHNYKLSEQPCKHKEDSKKQASFAPRQQREGEPKLTIGDDKADSHKPATSLATATPSKLPPTIKDGHLTVSQQAHEECMEDARDQHTADRSNELDEDEENPLADVIKNDNAINDSSFSFKDEHAMTVATGSAASVSSSINWVTSKGNRNRKYGKQLVPKSKQPKAEKSPIERVLEPTLQDNQSIVSPDLSAHEPPVEALVVVHNDSDNNNALNDHHESDDAAIDENQESDNHAIYENQESDDVEKIVDDANPANKSNAEPKTSLEPVVEDDMPAAQARARPSNSNPLSPKTSTGEASNSIFCVGDVVEVQQRTWSGINRPGGTARVTKVYNEEGSYFYDVVYVLGGRERKLDAVFVSVSEANADTKVGSMHGNNVAKAKKSKRLAGVCIPPALLAQLSAEGFDTTGLDARTGISGQKRKQAPGNIKLEPKSDEKRRATVQQERTTNIHRSNSVGDKPSSVSVRRRSNKSETTSNTSRAKENFELQRKRAKSTSKSTSEILPEANRKKRPLQTNPRTVSKRRKSAGSHAATTSATPRIRASLEPLTDDEKCEYADVGYVEWFNDSLRKSTVNVVASGLSEGDKVLLDAICKESKKSDVKVTLTDSFLKTTLCLVPAEKRDGANLVSRSRTLKTMRAALAGIPIVDRSWVNACKAQKKVIVPTREMFVRSLPSKTSGLNQAGARFGVAALAASVRETKSQGISTPHAAHPLNGVSVLLCGSFKIPKKTDVQVLLRESGCTIIPSSAAAVAKLSMLTNENATAIVLLCDDETSNDHSGISIGLAKAATEAIEHRQRDVIVVNTQWLFDCISCCDKLLPDFYQPHSDLAKRLWEKTLSIKP